MGFPDWDPNTHAAYTDRPYSYPASAAEGFLTPDFYSHSDPGRPCSFPLGMEDPLDTRPYAEPPLPQAGSWRGSGLPSGPPQLPPVVNGPSLDAARAHMLALGPQKLLAQDEEGDTLLHLFAARGLRWAAYAAAEMLQAYRHLDIREHKGKTPLLVAAAANQPLIVEDLLNLGAEPNATDHQGRSVLHVAATYGLPRVLSAVINSGVRVDIEARDFEGDQEQQDSSALGCAGCQPDPGSAAAGAAAGRPAGLCQHEGPWEHSPPHGGRPAPWAGPGGHCAAPAGSWGGSNVAQPGERAARPPATARAGP
ncbi:NF-kappa-B inhibitor delta isoform X2 [Globicephala melas]|uniref:NF-kappa-B inhibitor delta isoform X2 n=1 Tax=Globicephala melas TaxID=9731 RepID=UPI00293D6562|nr:NF-kappa-B inhibitor delta isoform X2 [Globicephala melas]